MIFSFKAPADLGFFAYRPLPIFNEKGESVGTRPISLTVVSSNLMVVSHARDDTLFEMFDTVTQYSESLGAPPHISLNRVCNEIARTSRRGVGNVVFGKLSTLSKVNEFFNLSGKTLLYEGRVVDENVPDNELFVVYWSIKGDNTKVIDGPFAWDGTDLRVLPEWQRYCARLKLS